MNVPMTEVEISISCKNLRDRDALSKSDPVCVLYMAEFGNNSFREIERTERINNSLNPEFAHKFKLNYYFEEAQKLKFEIYDIDSATSKLSAHDFLGRAELTLGEVVGAPGSKVHKKLSGLSKNAGSIIISAEEVGSSKEVAYIQFKGLKLDKKDFLGKSDPFLTIYRLNDDGSRTLAFRSEIIKNNLNPTWRQFKVPMRLLCGNNHERTIHIDCHDYDNDGGQAHDLIGSLATTFSKLSKGVSSLFDLINPHKQAKKKGYKNSGQLQLVQCQVKIEPSFLDYIRGGTQIHFTVAVDFTASNGNPMDPRSLHYIHPYEPNQYTIALKAVGEICQDYDADKMFPALGFGAKLPSGQVSHEFFLNLHPSDPHCYGVEGILNAYRQAIMSCTLYGPTNFSPVINHVAKFASASAGTREGMHYFVLLIITDGVISDIDRTIASIVSASTLPMSIIIVGVGNADFAAMEVLDADKQRLSSGGHYAERDTVQFVPFRNFYQPGANWAMSQAKLAKEVLKEIPQQLVGWMQTRMIQPKPPKEVDPNQLAPAAPPPGEAPPPAQFPPGQAPPGQFPPGQAPPGQCPPGQYPSGQAPPGQYPPGQAPPPGQYPPGQAPPPGQYPRGQAPPTGQYQPGQAPPGQGPPPGQYQPGQAPPSGYYHPGGQQPAGAGYPPAQTSQYGSPYGQQMYPPPVQGGHSPQGSPYPGQQQAPNPYGTQGQSQPQGYGASPYQQPAYPPRQNAPYPGYTGK